MPLSISISIDYLLLTDYYTLNIYIFSPGNHLLSAMSHPPRKNPEIAYASSLPMSIFQTRPERMGNLANNPGRLALLTDLCTPC